MSEYASNEQNKRLTATTKLLSQLQQNYRVMYDLTQDDVSAIIKNLSDLNAKFQQTTCNVLTIMLQNLDKENNDFVQLMTQDFNINFIIEQVISNFKAAKAQARQENLNLGNLAVSYLYNYDQMTTVLDQNLRQSKNAFQKITMMQLIQDNCQVFDNRQIQKLNSAIQTLLKDQNTEVRQVAQQSLELLQQVEPVQKQTKSFVSTQKSAPKTPQVQSNQSTRKQAGRESPSYFPTPSESDQSAQNNPFSIVPAIQMSYLPYKPSYLFEIHPPKPGKALMQVRESIVQGRPVRAAVSAYLETLRKGYEDENEWSRQLTALQHIFQLMVMDINIDDPQVGVQVGQEIASFLAVDATQKIVQSPRSTLSREAMIILELIVQRYGSLCQPFVTPLLDTLFGNLARKGVYFECQSDSLLKSIILHCGNPKQILTRAASQLKSQKVPSAKCFLMDLALMSLLVMKIINAYDSSQVMVVSDSIIQALSDREGRVRQTARIFVNALSQMDQVAANKILQNIGQKEMQQLRQDNSYEAGYQTYKDKITCRVDEPYFPSFFLQSGSCNQQIRPLSDGNLQEWRARLILDEQFQLYWGQEDEYTNNLAPGQEDDLFGTGQVQWGGEEELAPESSQDLNSSSKTTQSVTSKQTKFASEKQDTQIKNRTTSITGSQSYQVLDSNTIKMQSNNTYDRMDNYRKKLEDLHASISDEEIMEALQNSGSIKAQTAIHLTNNAIDEAILLQNVRQDLENISQYLLNDEMNDDQIDLLIAQIIALVFTQPEDLALQMQNTIMQIITLHELQQEQITQIAFALVDLFNNENLTVRRKSDEILRTMIEVVDPKVMLYNLRSIILKNKGNKIKQLNVNASLRLITYVVRKFTDRQLLEQCLKDIVPLVVEQFQSTDANTRKTAVGCFIDMFMVVGQGFQPYVDKLSDVQLKLVVERMKMIKAKAAARGQ